MLKHCIIGSNGFISKRHRKAIENIGGELFLTCDLNGEADFKDWVEMIHSPKFIEVDMVSVCTPNYLHSVMIKELLFLGKKVLCEKPLTIFDDITIDSSRLGVVLQLRHNQVVKKLKEENFNGDIKITVKSFRPPEYWESWKGDSSKSGGILYNMCVHYFDLFVHLLGDPISISYSEHSQKLAKGKIIFQKGVGEYHIELTDEQAPVVRKIAFNGTELDLEGATIPLTDNGQIINLHTEVYKEFISGKRVGLAEAKKSLDLIKFLL